MGHFRKVGDYDISCNVLSHRNGQFAFGILKFFGADNFSKPHRGGGFVGHLYSHGRLAWNRGFYSHADGGKVKGDVVRKVGYLAYFNACCRLKLISRNRRAAADIYNARLNAEALESIHKQLGILPKLVADIRVDIGIALIKKGQRRITVFLNRFRLDGYAEIGIDSAFLLFAAVGCAFAFFRRYTCIFPVL